MERHPAIGVGVIIIRAEKVLLGWRKQEYGAGSWQFPGGHLKFGESVEDCARREVLEETNLEITHLRYGPYTDDILIAEEHHYITLFVIADYVDGTPEAREPEKGDAWNWFSWDTLPQPLFLPIQNLVTRGFSPFIPH